VCRLRRSAPEGKIARRADLPEETTLGFPRLRKLSTSGGKAYARVKFTVWKGDTVIGDINRHFQILTWRHNSERLLRLCRTLTASIVCAAIFASAAMATPPSGVALNLVLGRATLPPVRH
jgi:hypothetical protein